MLWGTFRLRALGEAQGGMFDDKDGRRGTLRLGDHTRDLGFILRKLMQVLLFCLFV